MHLKQYKCSQAEVGNTAVFHHVNIQSDILGSLAVCH